MIKAEKAHITNLRADKAIFKPNTWGNAPNPTTPIRSEMLNKLESILDNKYDQLIVDFTPEKIKPKFTNCKNCGAPLKSCECEYCGTQYGKE